MAGRPTACRDCGRPIFWRGPRCRDCYLNYRSRQRSRYWHEPEYLEGQEERDRELRRSAFFVYVLQTDYGHYVGHTSDIRRRMRQHQAGEVQSTAGGNPSLLWRSRPMPSREDATRFEAAIKSWRDSASPRYRETTGFAPEQFRELYPRRRATAGYASGREPRRQRTGAYASRGGCLALPVLGLAILALAAVVLLG